MEKILITGATGLLGSSTIKYLLNKGVEAKNIYALVRDTKKAENLVEKGINLKIGNYDDYPSLVEAFKEIDKLFFVSGSEIPKRVAQHENIVKAAKEAKVKHIIYTSFQRKNETETSPIVTVAEAHLKTEDLLKNSGINYTIMKNNLYMDIIPMFIGNVLETGTIYQPAADGKVAFVLRDDIAEVAANILTTTGHKNKEYDITANEAYSYNDIAVMISEITGKTINYISPSVEEYRKTLTDAGVPNEIIGMTIGFSLAQAQTELDQTANIFENLLGRKPVSLQEYLKKVYK
ncbi:SDR family oxidoreductase [Lutibacter sp. B1]|uniref:SDR family oxidoreductase n=1 Tax=Lutibacter sp. B1 TaxID=2725996 RepID=UPI0014576A98|nr:SDR family oxidoreductase [Lutibacter sp. B1]NLP58319.1 SDR family oxidoreductase [Lutibacter sp. B1]